MSSLEEQARSRKEKLAQLRGLKRKNEQSEEHLETGEKNHEESNNQNIFKSRNFDIETREAKVGYENAPDEDVETVEVVTEELRQNAMDNFMKKTSEPLDLSKLEPKSVTWDLERDLEPKMKILETRTDNAIIKLVRERLQKRRDEVGDKDET